MGQINSSFIYALTLVAGHNKWASCVVENQDTIEPKDGLGRLSVDVDVFATSTACYDPDL